MTGIFVCIFLQNCEKLIISNIELLHHPKHSEIGLISEPIIGCSPMILVITCTEVSPSAAPNSQIVKGRPTFGSYCTLSEMYRKQDVLN